MQRIRRFDGQLQTFAADDGFNADFWWRFWSRSVITFAAKNYRVLRKVLKLH
jgi:hypothetical protein